MMIFAQNGKQYKGEPQLMLFGGMADAGESPKDALPRELGEEFALHEDTFNFLLALRNEKPYSASCILKTIQDSIITEYATRIEEAQPDRQADVIAERDLKFKSVTSTLESIAERLNNDATHDATAVLIDWALEAHDKAMEVVLRLQDKLSEARPFYEEDYPPSGDEYALGWRVDAGDYFHIDLSDDDYNTLKRALQAKLQLGLKFEISGFAERTQGEVRHLLETDPETFRFSTQRNAIQAFLNPTEFAPRHTIRLPAPAPK